MSHCARRMSFCCNYECVRRTSDVFFGSCCTVQLSGCSSTVHVLTLCLNVSVTFRSSKYAHLLLELSEALRCCELAAALHSITIHLRFNTADRLQEATGRPHSEAGGSLSQDVFSQMGAHRASDVPFDRTRPHCKALSCVEGKANQYCGVQRRFSTVP